MGENSPEVVIKEVAGGGITLSVNGEMRQIKDQLSELKSLLGTLQVQNVQYADKIYNISHIDEANFGFMTGKKPFNEHLTRQLIEAIALPGSSAATLLQRVASIPDWEKQSRISDKAKEIISYSYVGIIGMQLSKLMAIGKEDFSETKQRKYLQKTFHIAKLSLDLLNFALIAQLWDSGKSTKELLPSDASALLGRRFNDAFAPTLDQQALLLKSLVKAFNEKLPADSMPFPELANWSEEDWTELDAKLVQLSDLEAKLDKAQFDMLDCAEAEKALALLLGKCKFLTLFRMASIKQISFELMRNSDPRYLHRYTSLGIDSKANVDAERLNYTGSPVPSDSVLLYRGENYATSINLFPFVIDLNALNGEVGTQIAFFQAKDISTARCLEYLVVETGGKALIEWKGVLQEGQDLNELLMRDYDRHAFQLDKVIQQLESAQASLIPEEVFLDDL